MGNSNGLYIKNRKAYHKYIFIEEIEAGIVLFGPEVKSIRAGKISLQGTFCVFINGELFIKNMHISEYEYGTYNNQDPLRDKKLLLSKKELRKLNEKHQDSGFTIVPISIYTNSHGIIKVKIALAKGKKMYDHREALKDRDADREKNETNKN